MQPIRLAQKKITAPENCFKGQQKSRINVKSVSERPAGIYKPGNMYFPDYSGRSFHVVMLF
jgi:hypothetical protein